MMDEVRLSDDDLRAMIVPSGKGHRDSVTVRLYAAVAEALTRGVALSAAEAERDEIGRATADTFAQEVARLGAHIGRLRGALEKIRGFAWQRLGGHGPKYPSADVSPEEYLQVIKAVLSSTPADFLGRLRFLEVILGKARAVCADMSSLEAVLALQAALDAEVKA